MLKLEMCISPCIEFQNIIFFKVCMPANKKNMNDILIWFYFLNYFLFWNLSFIECGFMSK